jgi:hypothetical protein
VPASPRGTFLDKSTGAKTPVERDTFWEELGWEQPGIPSGKRKGGTPKSRGGRKGAQPKSRTGTKGGASKDRTGQKSGTPKSRSSQKGAQPKGRTATKGGASKGRTGQKSGPPGSRGGSPGSRGGSPGSRGGSPGSRGGSPGSRGGSPGSRGGRRKPEPDDTPSRRSVLMGGAVLLGGAGFIAAGALDLLPAGTPVPVAPWEPELRDAVPSKPGNGWLFTTTEWDALPPDRTVKVRTGPPKYIVIHHTSTRNVDDYSVERARRLAQGIQKFHFRRGWADSGQHFTISRGGHILEGRTGSLEAARKGHMVIGTQVAGANDYTVGIECEGNYNKELPPKALLKSLVKMCAWLCVQYDLNPREAIVPHRKFNDTDCCGDRFAPTLPRLRDEVAKAVPAKLLG